MWSIKIIKVYIPNLPSYHLWYCCLTVHSYIYCEHITQCYNFWFTQLSFRVIQRKKKIKKREFHNTLITFSTFFYFVYSSFHPVLYFFCLAELTLPLLVKWVCCNEFSWALSKKVFILHFWGIFSQSIKFCIDKPYFLLAL